jgi:hypothetical protein
MGLAVVMMASADEGGAGGLSRRQNLDNPTAPRQPQGLGVRLKQRAYVILAMYRPIVSLCFTPSRQAALHAVGSGHRGSLPAHLEN